MSLHAELSARSRRLLEQLAALYDEPRVLDIELRASTRLRSSLARAYLAEGRITVAVPLLASRHLDEVLVHEVAHLVCHWRHGHVRPHGREWRALMVQAGQPARVRLDPLDVRLPGRRRRVRRARPLAVAAFLRALL